MRAILYYNSYMKKIFEKLCFGSLNIFISSIYLQLIVLFLLAFILYALLPVSKNEKDFLWVILIGMFLLSPLLWLLKFNVFKFIYKKKVSIVYNFLHSFLFVKTFRKKVFLLAAVVDVIIFIVSRFFSMSLNFNEYFIETVVATIIMGGNLTTTYLLFFIFCAKIKTTK